MKQQEVLFQYLLRLGDTNLILGHRLSELCGHGPVLEEDIALTNIALDLIGQSRILLSYAAKAEGQGRTEDDLAYLRDVGQFRNLLLAEVPNGDFAVTICRLFLYSAYTCELLTLLCDSKDEYLAGYAAKALKEATYHLRHSTNWMVRLGDGTAESHHRLQTALNRLWMYIPELFDGDAIDVQLQETGIAPDPNVLKEKWNTRVNAVLAEATLNRPPDQWMGKGGRDGIHTEHLGFILAELQYLQRAYPGNQW